MRTYVRTYAGRFFIVFAVTSSLVTFNLPLDLWSLAKQESFFLQRYNKLDGPI